MQRLFLKSLMVIMLLLLAMVFVLPGCDTDATKASSNLSKQAEMFEINRRLVFFSSITDTILLSIEGRISIEFDAIDRQLEVTIKTGPKTFKKHFLGLSEGVSYLCEQTDPVEASVYHSKIYFKPKNILPSIEIR